MCIFHGSFGSRSAHCWGKMSEKKTAVSSCSHVLYARAFNGKTVFPSRAAFSYCYYYYFFFPLYFVPFVLSDSAVTFFPFVCTRINNKNKKNPDRVLHNMYFVARVVHKTHVTNRFRYVATSAAAVIDVLIDTCVCVCVCITRAMVTLKKTSFSKKKI